jgi:hypothetical protein
VTPDDYDDLAYDPSDYKRPGYLDDLLDAADERNDR